MIYRKSFVELIRLELMNIRRIVAYSILSFVISASGTYVFLKKVMGKEGVYNVVDWHIQVREIKEVGVSLRNDWPARFLKEGKAQKLAINQASFGFVQVEPGNSYIYYTRMDPKPRGFGEELNNYALYRCKIDGRDNNKLIDLGNVQDIPVLFGDKGIEKGHLYLVRHNEDTNGDNMITYDDPRSIYQCMYNGEKPKKIFSVDWNYGIQRVSEGERFIAISTKNAKKPDAFLLEVSNQKKIQMPEGFEIAYMFFDGKYLILSSLLEDNSKKFFWYDRLSKRKPQEIRINPEFIADGVVSLLHVKDLRDKVLYLEKVIDSNKDGKYDYNDNVVIYSINLGARPKKGQTWEPKRLTPDNQYSRFFTTSANKFVFYRGTSNNIKSIFVIPPSKEDSIPEPVNLFNIDPNVIEDSIRFSFNFEYLTYVKFFDYDGDGLILPQKDRGEIFIVHVPLEDKN
ncbi:hypothetical protein ACFL54_02255 [Planctomycetota bacterium]